MLAYNIGFSLLKSDKLEKRISGFREINYQIKQQKFSAKKLITTSEVLQLIRDNNLFENIFGEKYHIQLIQRSKDLIQYMNSEKLLGEEEIKWMWEASKKD